MNKPAAAELFAQAAGCYCFHIDGELFYRATIDEYFRHTKGVVGS